MGKPQKFEINVEETVAKTYHVYATDAKQARLLYESGEVVNEEVVETKVTWSEEVTY